VLGTVLFTELKGKAVQRYFMVDARNKVEAAINSLPNPGIRKPKSCSRKQKAPSPHRAATSVMNCMTSSASPWTT
jgi:hypothetical protein